MEWWTHLWLNEGYASFLEYLGADYLFPEFNLWNQFATETFITALELDALKNSHPIEILVNNPNEINSIFDTISYCKGGSVIRMLYNFIGEEMFRQGMNLYLTRYMYRNAVTEDLWSALEETSGHPIGEMMRTWTTQMGFPLIRVSSEQIEGSRTLYLTQEKFGANPSNTNSSDEFQWVIPLTFCSASEPNASIGEFVMKDKTVSICLPGIQNDEWIKLNPGITGFYRVHYSPELLAEFVPALHAKTFLLLDRLRLLDDLFAMVKSGQNSTTDLLNFIQAYRDESDFNIWKCISNIFLQINTILENTEYHDYFKAYGRHFWTLIAGKMGWESTEEETHLDIMLRSLALSLMVRFEDETIIEECKRRFELHLNGKEIIPADLRRLVYKAVLLYGDEEVLETVLKLRLESELLEEKERIAQALGAPRDPSLLQKVLEFAKSPEVLNQDSVVIIEFVSGCTKVGRKLAWEFIKANQDWFKKRYSGGAGTFLTELVQCTENFGTEQYSVEVEEFFQQNPFPGTERSVLQAVENVRLNDVWLTRDGSALGEYLTNLNLE